MECLQLVQLLKQNSNSKFDEFNNKMQKICAKQGYTWLDFASQFKLEDGTLNPDYCGDPEDMGIHFLGSVNEMWVDYFETHKIYPVS